MSKRGKSKKMLEIKKANTDTDISELFNEDQTEVPKPKSEVPKRKRKQNKDRNQKLMVNKTSVKKTREMQVGIRRRRRNNVETKTFVNEYIKNEPETKLLMIEKEILGKTETLSTPTTGIPQRQVIELKNSLDSDKLIELAYVWSVFAASRNVLTNDTVPTDVGQVGLLYMVACTIAYDLYYACTGTYSIFKTAPESYWELRAAITPKTTARVAYTWDLPNTFFEFVTNVPLNLGFVSLSWPSDPNTPQATMNTVIPVLTDEIVATEGVQACQRLWNELYNRGHLDKSVVQPEKTGYDFSTACFALRIPLDIVDNSEMKNWSSFHHEYPISGPDRWVMALGLCNDSQQIRVGPKVYNEFAGPQHYAHRVHNGSVGRLNYVVLRIKTIYIEDFFNLILSSAVAGDLQKSDLMGKDEVNQTVDMPTSPFLSMSPGTFVFGAFNQIMRRMGAISWVGFANPPCDDCNIIAGVLTVPDSTVDNTVYPDCCNETIASMSPLKNTKDGWDYVVYPQLVTNGKLVTGNIYENTSSGDPNDLTSVIVSFFPSFSDGTSTYNFGGDLIGLPDYIDFGSVTSSLVLGSAIPPAIIAVSNLFNSLQGNIIVASPSANFHTLRSVLHYTRILSNDNFTEDDYSQYQKALVLKVCNRVPFDPNKCTNDMSRVLPVTFAPDTTYQSIFTEVSSVSYLNGDVLLSTIISTTGSTYAHPVAGNESENTMIDESSIVQHQGGGFGFLKDMIMPLTEILGEIL